MSKLTAFIITR